MTFYCETTDIDLGNTSIENIFINDFMPMANGTYVKVYLLGYKYASENNQKLQINNESIARQLNIPLVDVLNAWDFWESKNIIKKHYNDTTDTNYDIEFLNLKQLYINNIIKPSLTNPSAASTHKESYVCTVEDLVDAKNIPSINDMFNKISTIISRPLVPNESKKILEWIQNYNMGTNVIVEAYKYAKKKKNKKNVNYINGIIRNWYDEGITNMKSLESYLGNSDVNYYKYNRIMKCLGLQRTPTEEEIRMIDKWMNEWSFSIEVILEACNKTISIRNPNLKYVNGILSRWKNQNINSLEDIEKHQEKYKNNKANMNNNTSSNKYKLKTKFHNFEQRTSKYSAKELEEKVRWKFKKNIPYSKEENDE